MADASNGGSLGKRSLFELERHGDVFSVEVPAGWAQGRGAFGGIVVAWLARAIESAEQDTRRVTRTLTAELVGPVRPGFATIRVEPMRVGSGVTTWSARLLQRGERGEELLAHAVASLGKPRVLDREFSTVRSPAVRPANDVDSIAVQPPMGPEFGQHVEYRPIEGLPMSAPAALLDGRASALGYARLKSPPPVVDTSYLAVIADAYWPAILATEEAPRPLATLSFRLDVLANTEGVPPEDPFLVSTRAVAGQGGYVVEDRQVFDTSGTLLALNRQTFVIIK